MKYLSGLPTVNGASDFKDSSMVAGTLVWLGLSDVDLSSYFINGLPVRHPTETGANLPNTFSRDQMIMLAAGLYKQGRTDLVKSMLDRVIISNSTAPNSHEYDGSKKLFGGDLMLPHHIGYLIACSGLPQGISPLKWLVKEIKFNAKWTPLREPNQLIAMCDIAGPEYVKFYKEKTPEWKKAISDYWFENEGAWRGEKEVGLALIDKVESYG